MPHGPWGVGTGKCVKWVRENKPDIENPGGYCQSIAENQGYSKTHDSETDKEMRYYHTFKDEGIEHDVSPNTAYWIKMEKNDNVPVTYTELLSVLPDTLTNDSVDIDVIGTMGEFKKVGRYEPIVLQFNTTEVDYQTAYELLYKARCPCVRDRFEFVWGVDSNVTAIPLYVGGIKADVEIEKGDGIKYLHDDKLPYTDKGGNVDKELLLKTRRLLRANKTDPWITPQIKYELISSINKIGVLNGFNMDEKLIIEGDGRYKIVKTIRKEIIGKGLNIEAVDVDETVLSVQVGDFTKSWIVYGYRDESSEYNASPVDELEKTIPRKIEKTHQEEASRITVLRDNRDEVVRFGGWEIRGEPTETEYHLTPYNPHPSFDFVLHKHTFSDVENYDVSINMGDKIVGFTIDEPVNHDKQVALRKTTDNLAVFDRDGAWMSGTTRVRSDIIDKGVVYVESENDGEILYNFMGSLMDGKCILTTEDGLKWEVHYL